MAESLDKSLAQDAIPALLGVVVVSVGWIMDLTIHDLPWAPEGLITLHLQNPLHWLIDLFPFYLVWAHRQLRAQRAGRMERNALRRALAEAQASRVRTRQLAAGVLDGLLIVGPDGTVVACNPAAEVMFGYKGEQLAGRNVDGLVLGLGQGAAERRSQRKTSRSDVLGVEFKAQGAHKAGSRFPAVVTTAPIEISSGPGTLYAVRDVGAQISQARTELRIDVDPSIFDSPDPVPESFDLPAEPPPIALPADARLLGAITQRLKAPLAAILGNATSLSRRLGADGEDQDLLSIEASGHALLHDLGNLVAHSDYHSGDLDLHVETVPIESIVLDAVDATSSITRAANNWVDTVIPDSGATCEVDQRRAREVLINLLIRANRNTEGGRIAVRVRREEIFDRYEVVFEVEDPGESLPDQLLNECTLPPDPQSQVLGMQLSRVIAERMMGLLTVTSASDYGNTSRLRVPSKDKPTIVPARSRAWKPAPREAPDKRDRTALLIGAAPVMASAIRRALEKHRWQVVEEIPESALYRVRDDRPQLLVFAFAEPAKSWHVWLEIKRHPVLGLIPAMCIDDGTYARKAWTTRLVSTPLNEDAIAALAGHLHAARIVPRALLVEQDALRRSQISGVLRNAGWWVHVPQDAETALELAADMPPELMVLGGTFDGGSNLAQVLAVLRGVPATRDIPTIVVPGRELTEEERTRADRADCMIVGPDEPDDMVVVHATIALSASDDSA